MRALQCHAGSLLSEPHVSQSQHLFILRCRLRPMCKVLCTVSKSGASSAAVLLRSITYTSGLLGQSGCRSLCVCPMTSGLGLADNVLNMIVVDYARLGGQHMDKWILCAGCQHREQPWLSPVHMRAVRWNVALSEMYCLATTASCNKKRHGL